MLYEVITAIDIAQQQEAKSLELRATVSLARLWQSQGKQAETRQVLADIYGWFTEGFDTVDLKEAKAVITSYSIHYTKLYEATWFSTTPIRFLFCSSARAFWATS